MLTNEVRRVLCVGLLVFGEVLGSPSRSAARTSTYAFSNPPDSIFVVTTPNNAGTILWPQILDSESGFEAIEGVRFENEINNTVFFDNSAVLVKNSSRMTGGFGWGDARNNGPNDPSYFTFDFTRRVGGFPRNVAFDFAVAFVIGSLPVNVKDTLGHMETISVTPNGTYTHGQGTASHGRAQLGLVGSLVNIARVELVLPVSVFGTFQVGIDNLVFDSGPGANFNGMGPVNAADLAAWRAAFGGGSGGDADGDGDTDGPTC